MAEWRTVGFLINKISRQRHFQWICFLFDPKTEPGTHPSARLFLRALIPYYGIFFLMAKNTSFILGDHFDSFVSEQVQSGRYANAADVIRSGLRLLEEHEERLQALRSALKDGEESGVAGPLDLGKIKARARKEGGGK